jgi:hypothetical protein
MVFSYQACTYAIISPTKCGDFSDTKKQYQKVILFYVYHQYKEPFKAPNLSVLQMVFHHSEFIVVVKNPNVKEKMKISGISDRVLEYIFEAGKNNVLLDIAFWFIIISYMYEYKRNVGD